MTDAADMKPYPAGTAQHYNAAREKLIEDESLLLDHVKRVAELRGRPG